MDLAKIRKKIKEAAEKSQAHEADAKTQKPAEEDTVIEEKPSEAQLQPEKETESPLCEAEPETISEPSEETIASFHETVPEPPKPPEPPESIEIQQKPEIKSVKETDVFVEEKKAEAEFLTFKLSKEFYAFRIDEVEEILRPQNITTVPRVESYIIGVTSLRGKIIPVIDLKKRLLLDDGKTGESEKVLILNGPKGSIGALVDKVIDVIKLPKEVIVEPPAHLSESEQRFIKGVTVYGDMFLSIIRVEEALNFKIAEA